jgi:hypothetical protein
MVSLIALARHIWSWWVFKRTNRFRRVCRATRTVVKVVLKIRAYNWYHMIMGRESWQDFYISRRSRPLWSWAHYQIRFVKNLIGLEKSFLIWQLFCIQNWHIGPKKIYSFLLYSREWDTEKYTVRYFPYLH